MLKNNITEKIFLQFSGKYFIKKIIDNYGYGKGIAYFLKNGVDSLLYKEELEINYRDYDYKILAIKEYRYVFEDNKITKYFVENENNSLFYRLNFISLSPIPKAFGTHLCNQDKYEATYIFLNLDSFILNYKISGPEKNYVITNDFERIKN